MNPFCSRLGIKLPKIAEWKTHYFSSDGSAQHFVEGCISGVIEKELHRILGERLAHTVCGRLVEDMFAIDSVSLRVNINIANKIPHNLLQKASQLVWKKRSWNFERLKDNTGMLKGGEIVEELIEKVDLNKHNGIKTQRRVSGITSLG